MRNEETIRVVRLNDAVRQKFEWGELTWYASEEIGGSPALTTGLCVLEAGCGNPRHRHPNCHEVLTVLEGRIEHTLAETSTVTMDVGDSVVIPPNHWHRAVNIGTGRAVLAIAFSTGRRETIGE